MIFLTILLWLCRAVILFNAVYVLLLLVQVWRKKK